MGDLAKPRILILTPFRNEAHSISLYLKSLVGVKYPKKLIDVFWLENDSSDKTLRMLKKARSKMPFNSTTLKSIKILGPVKKRKPREYYKDIKYGIKRRGNPWLVIWNEQFLPLVRKSKANYVLVWFADSIAPPNIINEYLKVFNEKKDAGWVGGKMYRRFPRHKQLCSPYPRSAVTSKIIKEVANTAHLWMHPRKALAKSDFWRYKGRDIHLSLKESINKQGLKAYYQPTILIKHVSTDGKIHSNPL